MTPILEVRDAVKRYGPKIVVDGVSFDVAEGELLGVIGPNGAGKTTLFNVIDGATPCDGGSVRLEGAEITGLAPYRRARMGIGRAYQVPRPFSGLSVFENVLVGAFNHPGASTASARRRTLEVLDEVGLADVGDRRVKGFSLGMRQRLGLAAALLGEPEVLILDEPANGLDPEGVHWLRKFLRDYAGEGRSVLVSSHLLAEIAQTVDDVVIVAKGRLVTQSSLADLAGRTKPGVWVRTPQSQELRVALASKGITAELQSADTLVALETTTEAVGIAAAGAGVVIFEMTAQHFDLEEFFLDLTTSTTTLSTEGASQ